MEIIVQRGPGDLQGPDIADPLLSDIRPALSRGRAELDEGEGLQTVRMTTVFRAGVELGQLIEVHDTGQGAVWRGKVVGIQHRAQGGRLVTELEVVRK